MKKVNFVVVAVISLALISLMCLFLGTSYSYIISDGSAANTETIHTGNLDINITYNKVEYGNMGVGFNGDPPQNYATVTLNKTEDSQYTIYYTLNLMYTATLQDKQIGDYLPLENVFVALYSMDGGTLSESPIMGPIRVADLPITKYKGTDNDVNDILTTQYQLYVSYLNAGASGAQYALKAWLDPNTDAEFDGKLVDLDLLVVEEPYHSKNVYDITFTGSENYEVTLNGQKATAEGGNYTLKNIVEGTYTLEVKNADNIYETTLTITSDSNASSVSIAQIPTQVDPGNKNVVLQQLAYTNKTTVYQIMKRNASIQNSNIVTQYTLYNLPTAYNITAKQSLDVQSIGNFAITLNEKDKDISLSYNPASSVSVDSPVSSPYSFEMQDPTIEESNAGGE